MHSRHVASVAGHVGRRAVSYAVVDVTLRFVYARHVVHLVVIARTVLKRLTVEKWKKNIVFIKKYDLVDTTYFNLDLV